MASSGLLGVHGGGRPRALSEAMVTTAVQAASAESLTQIAQRVETIYGKLPCRTATLGVALKREGFAFKRNRFALKKSVTKKNSPWSRPRATNSSKPLARPPCVCCFWTRPVFAARRRFKEARHHEPNTHTRRSALGALDFGPNELIYATHARTVKSPDVVRFIDSLLAEGDGRPTMIVLDNASIHHSIDAATRERWLIDHKALLFYLPPYSPELNLIEIVWRHLKYRWRRFVTWTKETIDGELADLLAGYGIKFQTSFAWTLTCILKSADRYR
jgi:transposase